MRIVQLRTDQGRVLADQCFLANSFFSRLKGLLGRKGLSESQALALIPCDMVHTLGMKFPIDIIFVDRKGLILRINREVGANRIVPRVAGAYAVIEMAAGRSRELNLVPGNMIIIPI